jgi:hypothetical protein
MAKGHFSGTLAASNMAHHGGKVAGAGELTIGMGPGKAAMKTKLNKESEGVDSGSGKSDFKAKGMKSYNQE